MTDQRHARSLRTEKAIVDAASQLFREHGYAGTNLTDVAHAAGVSPRTVHVRFQSKADLLKRAIQAVASLPDDKRSRTREKVELSLSASTLEERVVAFAEGAATIQSRLAPLVAVVMEVEASEPVIAELVRGARSRSHAAMYAFWDALVTDGLIDARADVAWLAETTMLLTAAETTVLRARTFGRQGYAAWLVRVLRQYATGSSVSGGRVGT